jgi:predicted methyltransferase
MRLASGFRILARLVFLVGVGCAGAPSAAPSQPAPLVHRFQHAEQWAREFDDPARDAWQKPADVVAAMHIIVGMTVADIGAGTGYFEPYLSRAVGPSGTVLALDIEPDMIRYLRERATREHLDNVRPELVRVDDPRLPAQGVDRVLIVDTWHHIPGHAAYLLKLRAGLAQGATVTIVEFTMDSPHGPPKAHRIPQEGLVAELVGAGMKAEENILALPYQYVVVAR